VGLVRISNYFFYRGGSRRADSRAPMLIGTRTRVNVSRVTGRSSREITTQAQVLAPLWDGTHATGVSDPGYNWSPIAS